MKEADTKNDFNSALDISVIRLVDALPDAAFICDQSGRIVACSDEAVSFYSQNGKTRIIGSNLQSFFSFDSVEEAFMMLSVVGKTNSRRSGKFLVKKNFSENRYAEVSFSPVQDDDFEEIYILVIFREVSGVEAVIDEINKKGARLARIVDTVISREEPPAEKSRKLLSQVGETLGTATCAYFLVENGILNPSAVWESPFNPGISPLLCSNQIFDYINDQKLTIALIRKPVLTVFLESEAVNGTDYGVKTLLGVSVGSDEGIRGLLTAVFTSNYSLSKVDEHFIQTVTALLANKFTTENDTPSVMPFSFRELIDCFSDPVYIISNQGIILEVNRSAVSEYGFDRDEFIGQTPEMFSAGDQNDINILSEAFRKALQGETQKMEWWGKRKNGELFPCEIIYSKSQYFGQPVILAIGRDLTHSKKIEKELIRYNQELEESNNSKDKFFSILAHDLKNPFQGLLGFIDLLYDDLDELSIAQVKEYLANVRNASYHTYALLENLLEWSRIQSGKMPFTPSLFNIRDEINSVISVLENNARTKNIRLLNEVDDNIIVQADRNMIHSVIQNLITNSIKFSNTRGRVVIRGREAPQAAGEARSQGNGRGNWLEVSIADDGIGIPEEILPKLFKLNGQFSQAGTANEPGTGLGLVLCHEMVEKNGGRIWAESVAGQGTTFIFTIPLNN